jgi:ethanolamine utilization cobalamin adenosyltransferase
MREEEAGAAAADKETLHRRLDDLSRRLEVRTREFAEKGHLMTPHEAFANEIRARQARLREKVREAERRGTAWGALRAEVTRDYSSLYDDLLQFEERLDLDSMRRP